MKILQVINSLGTGGAEKLIVDTLPSYVNQGLDMDLLLLFDNNFGFTKQLQNLDICKIFVLNKSGNAKKIYNPLLIFKIAKILKNYDLAHIHLFPSSYLVVIANRLNGNKTKLIFTEHSTSNRRLKNKVLSLIDKKIYKAYSAVICITEEIKEILQKHTGLPANHFEIIANGVDVDNVKNALAYKKSEIHPNLSSQDKILIQVAGFRYPKDQRTLINAIALLPDFFKLILVGKGVLEEECATLASEIGVQDRVFFLGLRYDVPKLLKTADIIVLSSIHEGLSLSCIEGMASGRPFIGSDVSGIKEVVQGAGILFPVGNAKVLTAEIVKLINSPKLYDEIAIQCQERAKLYDIENMILKHIELYNKFD